MAGLSFKDWNSRMDLFVEQQDVEDDDEEEEEEDSEQDDEENDWTPSYGFPYSSEDNLFLASTAMSAEDVAAEEANNTANSNSSFLVLETIFEENSDDLETDDSESVCSDESDSSENDFESVIHVSPGESCESDSESERDVAVPKKRRKREAPPVPPRRMPSPDPPQPEQQPSLSRSSSLLQFECLEQALSQEELEEEEEEEEEDDDELIFRTSATDKPFSGGESQPPSFSSFSFDSLDTNSSSRRRCSSPLKDSLEEEDLDNTSSSPGCSSSDDESYFLDRHHKLSGGLGRSRLRSYRSFDSLVHSVRPGRMPLSCVSLENAVLTEEDAASDESKPASKKSSENLSEDSGFGEMSMRRQHAAQPIAEEDEEKVELEPAVVEPVNTTAVVVIVVEEEEEPVTAIDDKQEPDVPAAAVAVVASSSSPHPVGAGVGEAAAVAELNLEEFEEGQAAASAAGRGPSLHHSEGHTHDTTRALVQESASLGADQWSESRLLSDGSLVQFNSDLSVDDECPAPAPAAPCEFYSSAPSLLSDRAMSTVPVRGPPPPVPARAWDMHPPMEITEEILHKTTVSPDASPKTSKSNKFGSFFQRFSFRKSKGKKSPSKQSQEDIATTEAIHSVEAAAAELSNLGSVQVSKKERPPLPPVGPPKSRLLGIVGRRKENAQYCAATPSVDGWNQKIDTSISSNGGSKEIPPRAAAAAAGANKKASSLVNITAMNIVDIDISEPAPQGHHLSLSVARPAAAAANDPRAKSMEFLLDDENKAAVQPPENELRKVSERKLSEHELRVQRSLQRLDVPEWYKSNTAAAPTGSFLLRRSSAGTHQKWPGLNSKTTSLSSLQQSPHLRGRHQTPTAASPSPVVSPSPQERLSFNYAPFSRWSTSRLNSASTSPSGSTRSSFHYRQPYLGWRSQEKLLANTPTHYRTPAERLAATTNKPPLPPPALSLQPPATASSPAPNNAEVRSSIKEVTSAIVHYVNEKNLSPARPGQSPSPRGSKTRLWVESSFVGSRPIDQPETPSMPDEASGCSQPERMQTGGVIMNQANGRLSNADDEEDDAAKSSEVVTIARCESASSNNKPASKYQQYININFNIEPSACEDNASDVSDVELEPLLGPTGKPKLQDELKELLENFGNSRSSPPSATIADVLDSLLGLPTASRSPSPVISPGNSMTVLNRHRDQSDAPAEQGSANEVGSLTASGGGGGTIRRHSSGAIHRGGAKNVSGTEKTRRVSFELDPVALTAPPREAPMPDNGAVGADTENAVRCRYSKCGKVASLAEARRTFKTCHNCNAQVYCSRECRRAHWEKGHRKTCLHGRIGALCRRVANACKEHQPSLELLSRLARRGYLAHGRGCVKVFFSSPEMAERFAAAVAACAAANDPLLPGEPCYVRWSDLLPSEMGNEQYKELLRLCKGYNPDTRLVVYVAACVVSEVPSSGAVKWERQIITRCAKVRLHKNHTAHAQAQSAGSPPHHPLHSEQPAAPAQLQSITRDLDNPETLILTPVSLQAHEATQRRELIASNIQRQLKQRGVSLRKQFPEVYRKLGAYVESSESAFTPVTIYPKDSASGRTFMCIIMPVADPDRLQDVPTDSSRVRTVDIGADPCE